MAAPAPVVLGIVPGAQPGARAFQVVQVRPSGYVHAQGLTEMAEGVYFGLRRLGVSAFYDEAPTGEVRQIVIGAHLLDERALGALPRDAILYNSEQIHAGSDWLKGPYLTALLKRTVRDYSSENVGRLRQLGAADVNHSIGRLHRARYIINVDILRKCAR